MTTLLRTQWDRVAAWVAAAVGAVLLIVGWVKVSHTAYPAEQIPYLASAGLGALFLLGIAGTLWISADLRDEYAKLDEIARSVAGEERHDSEGEASAVQENVAVLGRQVPVDSAARQKRQPVRAAARSATGG